MRTLRIYATAILFLFQFTGVMAQDTEKVIDKVIAVVGSERILLSDVEQEMLRMKMQGDITGNFDRCDLFEQILIQKLLLTQSKIDSLTVEESNVDMEIDRRIKYFVNQMGSEKALENYFSKPIYEIKDDLREVIRDQMLTQQMQKKIVDRVKITPTEVKHYYKNLPKDSLPTIPEQFELQQILLFPPSTEEAKLKVKEKLLEIRKRVLHGERFSTLAVAYSEDRASAVKGGELGFRSRDELVKPFADAAFNLKEGQVSQIVETEYGFHIIQMIEKKNDRVNVRHILMKPQYSSEMLSEAISKLDSISTLIKADSITFERAAQRFSEDKKSSLNGGLVINSYTNTALFEKDHLIPADYYAISNLKEGDITQPFESRDEHANVVFKIIKLKRKIPAHKANLDEDYDKIQTMAKMGKEDEILKEWVEKKIKSTYILIDDSFKNCKFKNQGWIK
ncbi:MAG: peptidylprolyl isomerase [Bacteroidales bacterium]|nr:peptidylprolyl isomerase [Bacteroidales bacterium]HPD95261.1 peptidylprolyl isomerase [Tenuifilaceae bacterium]HRX31458.1 peptidylprolyl isomerase [Tenuifilaceae bacterium]